MKLLLAVMSVSLLLFSSQIILAQDEVEVELSQISKTYLIELNLDDSSSKWRLLRTMSRLGSNSCVSSDKDGWKGCERCVIPKSITTYGLISQIVSTCPKEQNIDKFHYDHIQFWDASNEVIGIKEI